MYGRKENSFPQVLFKAHEKAQDTVPAGPVLEPTHALLTEGGADALVLIPRTNDVRLINQTAQNSKKKAVIRATLLEAWQANIALRSPRVALAPCLNNPPLLPAGRDSAPPGNLGPPVPRPLPPLRLHSRPGRFAGRDLLLFGPRLIRARMQR